MRCRISLVLVAWAATILCSAPANADEAAGRTDGNSFTSFRRAEPDNIAASNGLVKRNGDDLLLRIGPDVVTFVNQDQCGQDDRPFNLENCTYFIYVRHSPEHHGFLLLIAYYEDFKYSWVDDVSGHATILEDEPHFSPSGHQFVVVKGDEASSFDGIQIWSDHGPSMVWKYFPKGYALYSFVNWQGEDRISLRVSTMVHHQITDLPAQLVHTSKGWEIEDPPEMDK